MFKSEKNFLEKLADMIPGLSGYRGRDERRETDKRLREFLAARIDKVRAKMDDLKLEMTNRGEIESLDEVGQLDRQLQKLADEIRFATYGYSGVFDQVKVKEEELDALYNHDLRLVGCVETLEAAVAAGDLAGAKTARNEADGIFSERKHLFDAP